MILSIAQVAKKMRCTRQAVHYMINAGTLPTVVYRIVYGVELDALERYEAQSANGHTGCAERCERPVAGVSGEDITMRQIAEVWGVHLSQVYAWKKKQRFTTLHVHGNKMVVKRAEVLALPPPRRIHRRAQNQEHPVA